MYHLKRMEKIKLIKELYLGIVIKELPSLRVAFFTGFAPDPEQKAHAKMEQWLAKSGRADKPHRIFGHNIDRDENLSYAPKNEGYKVLVTCEAEETGAGDAEARFTVIAPGRFLVTGIEGNFATDPTGQWIMAGWQRLNEMVVKKRYQVKAHPRWFEEELEPSIPGNLRLDLYLEIA